MIQENSYLKELYENFVIILQCSALIFAVILSRVMNVSWHIDDCWSALLLAGLPLGLGVLLKRLSHTPALASLLAIIGHFILLTLVEGALALLGTRSPAPIADSWLAAADNILPLSGVDIVLIAQAFPEWAVLALKKAYIQTGLYLFITLLAFLLTDRGTIAWRSFLIWGCSFFLVTLIAFLAPALGCYSQISEQQVGHLPKSAGRYFVADFNDFRNATEPVLKIDRMGAVISFPSFHTVCALILAQAWHGIRFAGPVAKLLAGVIIFSCIPMGGHYLVDLIAGAAVWWGVTLAVDRIGRTGQAKQTEGLISVAAA